MSCYPFARMRSAFLAFLGPLALAGVALAASGCTGEIGGREPTQETDAPICVDDGKVHPGPSPLRRMTRAEYNATVRDLVGDTTSPANDFAAEEEALGFNNNAYALTVTPTAAEKYMLAAEGVAERASQDIEGLTGCDPSAPDAERDACARTFIDVFGKHAFRRPLSMEEKTDFFAVYLAGIDLEKSPRAPADTQPATPEGFRTGIEMVIETALQSPQFLYRVELGEGLMPLDAGSLGAGDASAGVVPLTSWEMASRLSFFLWGSMPDDELFAAAESNELQTKEQVAAQARRMLESPKAREAVATFHRQWLDYDRVANVTKDASLFPDWSSAIGAMMQEEARAFIEHVIFDADGSLNTLLTAPYTIAPGDLAAFYGAKGASGAELVQVDFPAGQHAGLLTMGSLLAYYAHSNQTSPVHRGKLVREALLCGVIAPPPPDIKFELPMPDPNSTARERFKEHATAACAGCHNLMDPLGFGFESFDSTGRYRALENGQPVDASGEVVGTDIEGPFNGVTELTQRLVQSEDVRACYAKMWFRWAAGRGETQEDACTIDELATSFSQANGNIKELLVALTQTDAFLYRTGGVTLTMPTMPGGGEK